MRLLLSFISLVIITVPALATSAPGTVEGEFRINDNPIQLRWVYAQLHDNAERLLDHPKVLRLLLADREVPQGSLDGLVFLPVQELARQNRVQGLLVEFDPADPSNIVMTLLYPPSVPGQSLITRTLNVSGRGAITDWSVDSQRVSGVIEHHDDAEWDFPDVPRLNYILRFNAPLTYEPPITADLKKKDAQKSPQVRVLSARADALTKGDLEQVQALSSRRANSRNSGVLALPEEELQKLAKKSGQEMKKSLKSVQRVVVRGNRAVVIFPKKQWSTLVLEDGEWKSDD